MSSIFTKRLSPRTVQYTVGEFVEAYSKIRECGD